VLGSNPGGHEAVYGIILWAEVLESGDLAFVEILWQDGVVSNEFSDELRLFL
jgi:hypothetical protein